MRSSFTRPCPVRGGSPQASGGWTLHPAGTLADPQAFQEALGTSAGPFARRGLGAGGGVAGRGHWPATWTALGAAARPPRRLDTLARPPRAHPRLSLSEATRLHPLLASLSLPQVGRPVAFFPAERTCTNIDLKTPIRQNRGSVENSAPRPGTLAVLPERPLPSVRVSTRSSGCHTGAPAWAAEMGSMRSALPTCPQPGPGSQGHTATLGMAWEPVPTPGLPGHGSAHTIPRPPPAQLCSAQLPTLAALPCC